MLFSTLKLRRKVVFFSYKNNISIKGSFLKLRFMDFEKLLEFTASSVENLKYLSCESELYDLYK